MDLITEEDEQFMEKEGLSYRKTVGHGGFGVIFLVYSNLYKQEFAVKRIPHKLFAKNEVDHIIRLDSPYIVNLYGYYYFGQSVYLMMEFCPTNLKEFCKTYKLSKDELFRHAHSICQSIKACHDQQISHSDLKPSNFLIDLYGRVKICDFGLSYECKTDEQRHNFVGSIPFMAPEIIKMQPYDPIKADIWALGITLYTLAAGRMPWKNSHKEVILNQITSGELPSNGIDDDLFLELISKCLNPKPDERPTIDEILNAKYFQEKHQPNKKKCRGSQSVSCFKGPFIMKPRVLGQRSKTKLPLKTI